MTKPTQPTTRRWWRGAIRQLEAAVAAYTPVPLELRLRWGEAPLPADDPTTAGARAACAEAVDRLLADLGIPGRTVATVILAGPSDAGRYALRVNGRRACLATGDLEEIIADVARPGTALEELPAAAVPGLAASVCVAALHRRLSVLLRDDHVARILEAAQVSGYDTQMPDLVSALATVMNNGVSLRDGSEIGHVLADAGAGKPQVQLAELLIDRLRPASVDLLFADQTLRRITTADPVDLNLFTNLRIRIFDDTGMTFPDFRLVRDDSLPDQAFAFRVNAVVTSLWHLGDGEGLDRVAELLEQVLRRRAAWFVSLTGLDELVGQLLALPDTVQAVQARYPRAWLSAVGRACLEERLSLRRIATLLDWIIDLDPGPLPAEDVRLTEGPAPIGWADGDEFPSPRDTVALLRERWMEELTTTLPLSGPERVYRLPGELERAAETGLLATDESALEEVTAAVRTMLAESQPPPLVVPTLAARSRLRDALDPEFPGLLVWAEQAIPPSVHLVGVSPPESSAVTPSD
jgi:hypothetical protein